MASIAKYRRQTSADGLVWLMADWSRSPREAIDFSQSEQSIFAIKGHLCCLRNESACVVHSGWPFYCFRMRNHAECVESFTLRADICAIPDEAAFRVQYDETTIQVCKHLCTKLEGHRCSGFLYDSRIRNCKLTSFSGELKDSAQASSCDLSMKFYRRDRCAGKPSIACDFEDEDHIEGGCDVHQSLIERDRFEIASGDDHTFVEGGGHFAYLMETESRPGSSARFETEFFDVARTCVMIAYRIFGDAELNIYVRNEELNDAKIWSSKLENITSDSWMMSYVPVTETGPHMYVIAGRRGQTRNGGIAIDDLVIKPCKTFVAEECVSNARGLEYLGRKHYSEKKHVCQKWADNVEFLDGGRYYFLESNIEDASNFCRNPNGALTGPWCFVNSNGDHESCEIPLCECRTGWDKCMSETSCIKNEWKCDGKVHCDDSSDEIEFCVDKRQVSCSFADSFICGYQIRYPGWERTHIQSEEDTVYQLTFKGENAINGDSSMLISPEEEFLTPHFLSFNMKLENPQYSTTTKLDILLLSGTGPIEETLASYSVPQSKCSVCIPAGNYSVIFRGIVAHSMVERMVFEDTDFDVESRNFLSLSSNAQFSWKIIPATEIKNEIRNSECGVDTFSTEGVLLSPGYPQRYSNNLDCTYGIHQPIGSTTTLELKYFFLEHEKTCRYDWLQISNEDKPNDVGIRICGGCNESWDEYPVSADNLWKELYCDNLNIVINYPHSEKPDPTTASMLTENVTTVTQNMDTSTDAPANASLTPFTTSTYATSSVIPGISENLKGKTFQFEYPNILIKFHSDYIEQRPGFKILHLRNSSHSERVESAFVLAPRKELEGSNVENELYSGHFTSDTPHCLVAELFVSTSVCITLHHSYGDSRKSQRIFYVNETNTHDPNTLGLGRAWHRIHFNIPSSQHNSSSHFHVNTKVTEASIRYMMGINNLVMVDRKCTDLDGTYTLTAIFDTKENKPAVLLTPLVNITEAACLSMNASLSGIELRIRIYPFYQNHTKGGPITLIQSSLIKTNGTSNTIDTLLSPGTYSLWVEAYGSESRLHVREVSLTSGACESTGEEVLNNDDYTLYTEPYLEHSRDSSQTDQDDHLTNNTNSISTDEGASAMLATLLSEQGVPMLASNVHNSGFLRLLLTWACVLASMTIWRNLCRRPVLVYLCWQAMFTTVAF
ncbi:hypothetical protein CAPTEDRAFT_194982 [Capitella teleta]|uniref:Kringle domain-containing protein n=1 Tax=Capitella teleta TaxID=283909 RepID=R7VG70_CAPTE|nr:hypothetical protein CAPTEDRAFT_194982 [Capitella teleta]|eukprot:ELU17843.1 hypothetical protein CAPTEDRAFT_194982 [Capitella teleta]